MTQKLRIRIKRPLLEVVIHRRVEKDGVSCVVWKEKGDRPEWKFNFDRACVYPTKKMFIGGKQDTVDVFPYSTEAVTYNYRTDEEHQALYDRETEHKLVSAKVMEELGEGEKEKISGLTWIMLFLIVGTFIISAYGLWKGRI
jgi:hypothetical protein